MSSRILLIIAGYQSRGGTVALDNTFSRTFQHEILRGEGFALTNGGRFVEVPSAIDGGHYEDAVYSELTSAL